LSFLVTNDLSGVPGLVLLSREHLETIMQELRLSTREDLMAPETRVKLGRLLSAESFIYGEVQALPGDEIVLQMRWVRVENGVELLARHQRMRIRRGVDLLALEQQLVIESFVPAMMQALGGDAGRSGVSRAEAAFKRKSSLGSRDNDYLDYCAEVDRATQAEQRGNYKEAIDYWRKASEIIPGYAPPLERLEALELTIGNAATGGKSEH
jgi:hypothetical protein